jgi:hypothetical protein
MGIADSKRRKWVVHCLAGEPSVEGIKVCQMACHSIGKAWRRRKGKLAYLSVYVLAISNRCQHTSLDGCYCIAWRLLGNDLALWCFDEVMHGRNTRLEAQSNQIHG